jgi:hypothetical protein
MDFALAITITRPFAYTVANRGMGWMTTSVALPFVRVQLRAVSPNVFGDERLARVAGNLVIMPSRRSCRGELANPDTARVLRLTPRHDIGKAQQVKQGDFTLHEGKLIPNRSVFGFYRPHQPKKVARIVPRGTSGKPAFQLASTGVEGCFSA